MSNDHLDENHRFAISAYQQKRPFSSTLPGIAGRTGIPMWVFYVNRGQAITSFGVENKDHPLMEFQPANKAYQLTPYLGFRTFIKILGGREPLLYEPFAAGPANTAQNMLISLSELELTEQHTGHGVQVDVRYFILPDEPVTGLARQVTITNLGAQTLTLEILDGLPAIIPYGVSNRMLKENNRTIEAWMDVYNQERQIPFFRLRSSPGDTAEVKPVQGGNFALAYLEQRGERRQAAAVVNPEMVFSYETSLSFPANFQQRSVADLLSQGQMASGITPCAFFGFPAALAPGEAIRLNSLYGYARELSVLNQVSPRFQAQNYFEEKRQAAIALVAQLTEPAATKTSLPIFDAYCRQTFLDNVLRGGWPVHLGRDGKAVTYHIYSRKHGDPERDYNAFFLAAESYSQGNGNYRDVNQNRRSEVLFDPQVEDANIRSFLSLIQIDGYNPLVVKGSRFLVPPARRAVLLSLVEQPARLASFLEKPFTPGGLLRWVEENQIPLKTSNFDFLQQALHTADQYFDAEFGEGYWTDHWTYNLDLINSFLAAYPDRRDALLFERADLPFFDSPAFVQPRSQKYVLVGGQPRQYEAVIIDSEKAALIASRREFPNMVRAGGGHGEIYRTNLYTKLFLLALVKFTTLDPQGMGVEMEADRPAWCDALNGLPGLFGSSLSETFELERLLTFLLGNLPARHPKAVQFPVEAAALLDRVMDCLRTYESSSDAERDFAYWEAVSTARETYRESVRLGISGETRVAADQELSGCLSLFLKKVQAGIDRALRANSGFPPTYFYYEVTAYDLLDAPASQPGKDEKQDAHVRARRFQQQVLPIFLEGVVRMFKTLPDPAAARHLHQQVRRSALYDAALKMYKTNAPLDGQPMEIGRLRAFTPGWLENESIFLHMEYKYLLELLRAGLYDEFFDDFRSVLVAFHDPARYGRSPLENVSFIVSSAHPDRSLHGAGFVARLTGATAEFLSMWSLMMLGPAPFFMRDGELCLRLQPALPGWLFDEENSVRVKLFGRCQVIYDNPFRENTYSGAVKIQSIRFELDGQEIENPGEVIAAPYAAMVREGRIPRMRVTFARK